MTELAQALHEAGLAWDRMLLAKANWARAENARQQAERQGEYAKSKVTWIDANDSVSKALRAS